MSNKQGGTTGRAAMARAVQLLGIGAAIAVMLIWGVVSLSRPPEVEAATSSNLNFQARLLTNTGALVADNNYHVEFKLYNASTSSGSSQGSCSGDSNCLWTETRSTGNLVRVVNGYLTVNLGSVTSFPAIDWDQDLWLTMRVGGSSGSPSWDAEMSPRLKLTAVPYAFRAGELAKYDSGSGFTNKIVFATPSGSSKTITAPNASGTLAVSASGNIALDSAGNITLTGQVPIANGGTNATTAQGAINNLSGLTTTGDLLFYTGGNATRLARGANGECLTSNTTTILWGSCGSGSLTVGTFSNTATANGLDYTTGTLTLHAADASNPGAVSTTTQSFAGDKTFTGNLLVDGNTTIGNGSGDTLTLNGTAVSIPNNLNFDSNTLFLDAANNRIGVGTTTTTLAGLTVILDAPDVGNGAILGAGGNLTSTTNDQYGIFAQPTVAPGSASTRIYAGVNGTPTTSSANVSGASIYGLSGGVNFAGTGTLGTAGGLGILTTNATTGTITTNYGINIFNPANSGTITTNYGMFIASQTAGTTDYGLYIQGADAGKALYVNAGGATIHAGGLTIDAGGETITSGGLTVTAGGINVNSTGITNAGAISGATTLSLSGAISGGTTYSGSGNINTTGGALQTNSTDRVDNSGNLVNIGNITGTGAITMNTTGNNALTLASGATTATASGGTTLSTGATSTGSNLASGALMIATGNTTGAGASSNSGNITINTGSSTNGSVGTIGIGTTRGAVTIGASGSGTLTLQGATLAMNAATWQRTAAGTTALDLNDGSNTTLALQNSGAGVANLTVDGSITAATGLTVTTGGLTVSAGGASISGGLNNNTGNITNAGSITGVGANITGTGAVTLSSTSGDLNLATATSGDVVINGAGNLTVQDNATFNGTATFNSDVDLTFAGSENLSITSAISGSTTLNVVNNVLTNTSTSGTQQIELLQNADSTGVTETLLALDNADVNQAVGTGILLTAATGGGMTIALDASDADIGTAIALGANDISGTNFNFTGSTALFTLGSSGTAGQLLISDGTSNTVKFTAAGVGSDYTLTLPTAVGSSGDCLKASNGTGSLTFGTCASTGLTRRVTMIPEFPGAVMKADGSLNSGTMTSDYDSTGPHNYYEWTSAQSALQDYDIYVRTTLPSEMASVVTASSFYLNIYGTTTAATDQDVNMLMTDASGTTCYNASLYTSMSATTWAEKNFVPSGCTFAANDTITFKITVKAKSSNVIRIGELRYNYLN